MTSINVELEGREQLVRELRALGGPRLRSLARKVASSAMAPIVAMAKGGAPVGPAGRLRASIGKLATTNRAKDAFTSRVGVRRDFTYRTVSGVKTVSGRGKVRERARKKGGYAEDTKSAQQYARVIEFGVDSSGRIRRKAGPAHFLENAITRNQTQIIGTVSDQLRQYVETQP